MNRDFEEKIKPLKWFLGRGESQLALFGLKMIATYGCFDILHPGHVQFLQMSSKLGDILVVGVNTDGVVKNLKPGRPINSCKDRLIMLAALGCVDYVCSFSSNTGTGFIKTLCPDVVTKSSKSWDEVPKSEFEAAKQISAQFLKIESDHRYSSSSIINRIKEKV